MNPESTSHLIIHPGLALTFWLPRDDRPGWAMGTVTADAGPWSTYCHNAKAGDTYGVLLDSPWGKGVLQLMPVLVAPPRTTGEAPSEALPSSRLDLIMQLGEWVTLWCQPKPTTKWFRRSFMANAMSLGFRLTAGKGGQGIRGRLVCNKMEPHHAPPPEALTMDAVRLLPPAVTAPKPKTLDELNGL